MSRTLPGTWQALNEHLTNGELLPLRTPSKRTHLDGEPTASPLAGVFDVAPGNYRFLPVARSRPVWLRPPWPRPRAAELRPSGKKQCSPFKRRDFWPTSSTVAGRGSFTSKRSLAGLNSVAPRPSVSAFCTAAWVVSASTPYTRGAGRVLRRPGRGVGRLCGVLAT